MSELRIFSYLSNPRVWKAVTAARIGCVGLAVRGAVSGELVDRPWDFEARRLSEVSAEERAAAERMGRVAFKDRKFYKTDDRLASAPAFAPAFGPYLAKFATEP